MFYLPTGHLTSCQEQGMHIFREVFIGEPRLREYCKEQKKLKYETRMLNEVRGARWLNVRADAGHKSDTEII